MRLTRMRFATARNIPGEGLNFSDPVRIVLGYLGYRTYYYADELSHERFGYKQIDRYPEAVVGMSYSFEEISSLFSRSTQGAVLSAWWGFVALRKSADSFSRTAPGVGRRE